MALVFGTNGVRGLVTDLTGEECFLYTTAFVRYVKSKTFMERVALTGDLRRSTPGILRAVAAALAEEGIGADFAPKVPTPAVAAYAMARNNASIVVTGSHLFDDRNGIKFFMPWGEVLKADAVQIEAIYRELKKKGHSPAGERPTLGPPKDEIRREFVSRYTDYYPSDALAGKRIVVFEQSTTCRDVLPEILEALGAEVVTVGRSESFVAMDTERAANPGQLASWVSEHGADALVSADADGDRPFVVDESGKMVRGDILGILAAASLDADSVSAPVNCNSALEKCGSFKSVSRTRTGSAHVIEAMNDARRNSSARAVGYEANGGFFTNSKMRHPTTGKFLAPLPTRDSVLPIVAVLDAAARRSLSLSTLVGKLPPRFSCSSLIETISTATGKEIIRRFRTLGDALFCLFVEPTFGAVEAWEFVDGVRMTFAYGEVVHLRLSGSGPGFRIDTEASDERRAALINRIARTIVADGLRPAIEDRLGQTEMQQLAHVVSMNTAPASGTGMDVVIVSTSSERDEQYWQKRLDATRGQICKKTAITLAVHEDWPGGAGTALGTLHALGKARDKCARLYGVDILDLLGSGVSVGLYHTAGKGTRLAPLPASEGNNKPAVQLPGLLEVDGRTEALTVLEAAIKQTAIYAPSRKGRLSVFFSDQVFVPSTGTAECPSDHHVHIMTKNFSHSDSTAIDCILDKSIGSFTMSAELVTLLLDEFDPELSARRGKMDTDLHFWMPFALDKKSYVGIMAQKGEAGDGAADHYDRIARFKQRFFPTLDEEGLVGAADVGPQCYWWDFGTLDSFRTSLLKLVGTDAEASAARAFFGIGNRHAGSGVAEAVDTDDASCLLGSKVSGGKVRRSVLIGVSASNLDVSDSVLVGTAASNLEAKECLLYKVSVDGQLAPRTVRADVRLGDGRTVPMQTSLDRDGKADWTRRLPRNAFTFEELHETIGSEKEKSKKTVF